MRLSGKLELTEYIAFRTRARVSCHVLLKSLNSYKQRTRRYWDVELHIKFSKSCSYSSRLFSSKCFTMAASILLVRVTRGVFDDEDEGGLVRMATIPLLPNVE